MIVECRAVTKRFGPRVAVSELDLGVQRAECFGLLGPNGAGKTTTLKMVYGVTKPSAGEVRVFDQDVSRHTRRVRKRLGVTLQESSLIESLTPVENLAVFGRYHLLSEAEIRARTDELLDFLELRSHAEMPVVTLSGGFQRRLAIAMSLMNRPELLILDEPTTGLDPAVRLSLWARVRALREQGTTVLLTTHYMDEAERLCDRLAVMAEGRLVAEGAPRELIETKLARDALELALPEDEHARWLSRLNGLPHLRAADRLTLYAPDGAALLDTARGIEAEPPLVAIRPTNLEDVFLALTGATLEGDA